uniref:Uncharacterized protein n=1 Tax=Tetraselmis sp. GSL018 TaxID=582737 RepID=A0A061S7P5_9CHLO
MAVKNINWTQQGYDELGSECVLSQEQFCTAVSATMCVWNSLPGLSELVWHRRETSGGTASGFAALQRLGAPPCPMCAGENPDPKLSSGCGTDKHDSEEVWANMEENCTETVEYT